MPSPVGHLLSGAAIYLAGTNPQHRSSKALAVTLMGSIVADFDFLPGILIGEPAAFHHGVSHSLAFAVVYGALVFLFLYGYGQKKVAARIALLGTFAYAVHVILDAVSAFAAVPLMWPLWTVKIGIDLNFFGRFHHGGLERGIWSVLRWDNLPAVTRELTLLGVPVLLLFFWRERCATSHFCGCRVNGDEYKH